MELPPAARAPLRRSFRRGRAFNFSSYPDSTLLSTGGATQAASAEPLLSLEAFQENSNERRNNERGNGILPTQIFGSPRVQGLDGLRPGPQGAGDAGNQSGCQSDEGARRRDRAEAHGSDRQALNVISSVNCSRLRAVLSARETRCHVQITHSRRKGRDQRSVCSVSARRRS